MKYTVHISTKKICTLACKSTHVYIETYTYDDLPYVHQCGRRFHARACGTQSVYM